MCVCVSAHGRAAALGHVVSKYCDAGAVEITYHGKRRFRDWDIFRDAHRKKQLKRCAANIIA